MATGKVQLAAKSHLGLGIETTLGTAVAATGWVPVMRYGPGFVPTFVEDTGARGTVYETYGEILATDHSTYTMGGMLYPGSGGNLLAAVTGLDTVTGTSPYTHTFAFQDTPKSVTISDTYLNAQGISVGRQFPGSRCRRLQLKFTPTTGLSYTADFIGFPSATYTPETPTFGTDDYFIGSGGAITFGGTSDAALSSFSLDIQRTNSEPVFSAQNSQTPYDIFMGRVRVDWDLEFYMSSDAEIAYALSQATEVTAATVTQAGTGDVLTLTSSGLQFTKPVINRSLTKWVIARISGRAVYNATDSGVLQMTLKNAVSTSYTTQAAS